MPSISLTNAVAGTIADAGMINNNNAALIAAINGGLDNANISGSAAISPTKLSIPNNTTTFLRGDGTWATVATGGGGSGVTTHLKTTTLDNTGTSTVDMLGGISIATSPAEMTATGAIKLWCGGDYQNNTGSASQITWELKLGATTIWSRQNSSPNIAGVQPNRRAWSVVAVISALNSLSSQYTVGQVLLGGVKQATAGVGQFDPTSDVDAQCWLGAFIGASAEAMGTAPAKTLTLNATHSVSGSIRLRFARVEVS